MYVLHMNTGNAYMLIGPDLPRQHAHIHIERALQEGPLEEGPTCTHSTVPCRHPRTSQTRVRHAHESGPRSSKPQHVSTMYRLTTAPSRQRSRERDEEHQQSILRAGRAVAVSAEVCAAVLE